MSPSPCGQTYCFTQSLFFQQNVVTYLKGFGTLIPKHVCPPISLSVVSVESFCGVLQYNANFKNSNLDFLLHFFCWIGSVSYNFDSFVTCYASLERCSLFQYNQKNRSYNIEKCKWNFWKIKSSQKWSLWVIMKCIAYNWWNNTTHRPTRHLFSFFLFA